jgi:hypothetical protein
MGLPKLSILMMTTMRAQRWIFVEGYLVMGLVPEENMKDLPERAANGEDGNA